MRPGRLQSPKTHPAELYNIGAASPNTKMAETIA
jgi:hypothetical protein